MFSKFKELLYLIRKLKGEKPVYICKEAEEEKIVCPHCQGTEFYDGPSGGSHINILCSNPECRHWFNFSYLEGKIVEDLNRINPTDEELKVKKEAYEKERNEYPEKCYEQGVQAYYNGESAMTLLKSGAQWHQCNGADLYRLAGFLDAMSHKLNAEELARISADNILDGNINRFI
jgi:hypothetical protein